MTVAGAIDTGGGERTIGAPIANSDSLNKNGGGRLHLPVDNSATLTGTVVINQGDVSVENNNGIGQNNSITVADGAALVLNGGANGLTVSPNVTIHGSGITNSGAIRNLSGVTTYYGQITLEENNSVIYVDSGSAFFGLRGKRPLTDNGSNYNLIISGSGTGDFHMGETSIGGTLIIEGPSACSHYLINFRRPPGKARMSVQAPRFYVEANNSFGANANPASLITTNVLLDGGGLSRLAPIPFVPTMVLPSPPMAAH